MAIPTPSSFWNCDESSGNLADAVGANTITNTGITFGTGLINNGAIILSGNYGQTGDVFDFAVTDNFSIHIWFKQVASGGNQMLISKGTNQWNLYLESGTNKLSAAIPGIARVVQNPTAVSDTNWHQAVLTHIGAASNDTWKLYQDGSQVDSQTNTGAMTGNALNVALGAEAGSPPTLSFNGRVDIVGIWSGVTLSAANVTSLYNSGAGVQYPFPGGASGNFFLFLES